MEGPVMALDSAEELLAVLNETHIPAVTLTSTQNATAAAVDLTTTEALANALKANYNAAQTDLAAVNTTLTTLLTELTTAGILKAS